LEFDLSKQPWKEYALPPRSRRETTSIYPQVWVPVGHPLNLDPDRCLDVDAFKALLAGSFSTWEVNARNILAELGGVIAVNAEWALRDAIGVAYSPYNRLPYEGTAYHGDSHVNPHSVKGLLLAGDPPPGTFQYALIGGWVRAKNPGESGAVGKNLEERTYAYEISLIIAYGVDRRLLRDTSFGATEYVARPKKADWAWDDTLKVWVHGKGNWSGIECGDVGPTFFYQHGRFGENADYGIPSEQLWRQQGFGTTGKRIGMPSGCKAWLGPEKPSGPPTPAP
jgi:hypothetical protein